MRFKNVGLEVKDEKGKATVQKVAARAKGPDLDINVPFGGEVEIPAHWAKPRRFANGARRPSPIEMVAPQLVPSDEAERTEWLQTPAEEIAQKQMGRNPVAMSVAALVAQGLPQGIAETLVATYQAALAQAKASVED